MLSKLLKQQGLRDGGLLFSHGRNIHSAGGVTVTPASHSADSSSFKSAEKCFFLAGTSMPAFRILLAYHATDLGDADAPSTWAFTIAAIS